MKFAYFGGWGTFPYISRIHTAYMTVRSSNLGTNNMFGDGGLHSPENLQQKRPWKMAFAGRGSSFPFVKNP